MKKITLTLFLIAVILCKSVAQESLDCKLNYRLAILNLKQDNGIPKNVEKAKNYLSKCIEVDDIDALALMGRIIIKENEEENYAKALKYLKKAAKEGSANAMSDLAIMYKLGLGGKSNFRRARKWFKKADKKGNDFASYSLGYMYLKGFGGAPQDYDKAVKWFKKSDYLMAKYWLGVCNYFGYGTTKNLDKASELLGEGIAYYKPNELDNNLSYIHTKVLANYKNYNEKKLSNKDVVGGWEGYILKLDWSGSYIEQTSPLSLSIKSNKSQILIDSWSIGNDDIKPVGKLLDNIFYADKLSFRGPHTSFSKDISAEQIYHVDKIKLYRKRLNGIEYLIGYMSSTVDGWEEPSSPMIFVLEKKIVLTNSSRVLSDEEANGLSKQKNSFIKLYPNPFLNDLIIRYSLEKDSEVTITLTNTKNYSTYIVESKSQQNSGEYNYLFNGNELEKGLYVVTIIVNGKRKTRTIIKN